MSSFVATITTFLAIMALGGKVLAWDHLPMISMAVACVAFAVLFIYTETSWVQRPFIPLRFVQTSVGLFAIVQILLFCAYAAVRMIFCPLEFATEADPD